MAKSTTIEKLASAVFDNGRRGNPRPGCDCEQCFGYCLVDNDKAPRDAMARGPWSEGELQAMQRARSAPLKF